MEEAENPGCQRREIIPSFAKNVCASYGPYHYEFQSTLDVTKKHLSGTNHEYRTPSDAREERSSDSHTTSSKPSSGPSAVSARASESFSSWLRGLIGGGRKKRNRVKVLPQHLLLGQAIPVEPSEPPPPPDDLVSLLVIGESNCGKSTLVRSFVSHETIPLDKKLDHQEDRLQESQFTWSAAYKKKDLIFFNTNNTLRSLRVQIWDTSNLDPSIPLSNMERSEQWNIVWKKTSRVLLVLPLAEADSWEEMLQHKIKDWKQWLDNQCQETPVVLMLHQADRLQSEDATTNATDWIQTGKKISDLCYELQIHTWHITSSCLEDDVLGNSIDTAFREILGDREKPLAVPQSIGPRGSTLHSVTSTVPADQAAVTQKRRTTPSGSTLHCVTTTVPEPATILPEGKTTPSGCTLHSETSTLPAVPVIITPEGKTTRNFSRTVSPFG